MITDDKAKIIFNQIWIREENKRIGMKMICKRMSGLKYARIFCANRQESVK